MTCEQARQYLWREPFQPVRIRLKDGRTFDVLHKGMTLAAEAILIIGIPPADEPNAHYSERTVWVRWPEVDTIEPLSDPAAPAALKKDSPARQDDLNEHLNHRPFQQNPDQVGGRTIMTCEQARQYLWREPFQPVRIRLKDGRTFDVPYSGWTLAAEAILIIGLPPEDDPNSRYSDRSVWVRWPEVDVIEPLSEPVTPAS